MLFFKKKIKSMFDRERRNMGRGSGKLGEKKRNKLEIEDVWKKRNREKYRMFVKRDIK